MKETRDMLQKQVTALGSDSCSKSPEVLIRNACLVDVENRELLSNMDIRITDGIISEIGKDLSIRSSVDVIEADGLYALPGFIDMHVHLTWDGGSDPVTQMQKDGIPFATLRGIANARTSLTSGVTTLRDLGSPDDIAVDISRAFREGFISGPTVIPYGRILQPTGGHVPEIGYIADGVQNVIVAVRALKERGAVGIKMASTGGAYGPEEIGPAVYTLEEMKAIIGEAHRLNLKVSTHALGGEGVVFSVEAGVDTIEHGGGISRETLKEMKKKGTVWIPTLAVYRMLSRSKGMIPDEYVEKAKKVTTWHEETFRAAIEEGVNIALGTDAGSPNFGPHPSVPVEMETMVQFGMAPFEVLASATITAAKALGMEDRIGSLKVGLGADIVLLKKNPVEDITAVRYVARVFKKGRIC